jgi:hypothetical protein
MRIGPQTRNPKGADPTAPKRLLLGALEATPLLGACSTGLRSYCGFTESSGTWPHPAGG